MSAQTGADALDFYKGQAAITNAWADEDRERYQSRFVPLQDAYIEKAQAWDSAGRQAQVASEAKADVMSNAAAAQQQNQRQMAAMGVSPASGRFAGQTRATALATGLAAAGAENTARTQARAQADAMQANALNMGSGLAVNPAASMQLSNGAMSSGTSAAMAGYGQQGQLLNQQYQNQLAAYNTDQQATGSLMSGLGSVAGLALGGYLKSDKDAKTDKAPADGKSLGAVKSLPPFESWRYKPGAVLPLRRRATARKHPVRSADAAQARGSDGPPHPRQPEPCRGCPARRGLSRHLAGPPRPQWLPSRGPQCRPGRHGPLRSGACPQAAGRGVGSE